MLYLLTLLSLPNTKAFAGTSERSLIIVPVALHRAKEIELLPRRSFELPANTILVVFAAKLIKKLVLHLQVLLSLPCVKDFAGTSARRPGVAFVRELRRSFRI